SGRCGAGWRRRPPAPLLTTAPAETCCLTLGQGKAFRCFKCRCVPKVGSKLPGLEHAPHYFTANSGFWKCRQNFDFAGISVSRKARLYEILEFFGELFAGNLAVAEDYECFDDRSAKFVRFANYPSLRNSRVFDEGGLNLEGAYFFTARDYYVVPSALEPNATFLVHASRVAGEVEAAPPLDLHEVGFVFLRLVPDCFHYRWPGRPNCELSDIAAGNLAPLGVENCCFESRQRQSHAAGTDSVGGQVYNE